MTAAEKLEQRGIDKGVKQGIEQGIGLGVERTALSSLREGVDVQLIAKITGLSESRILELAKSIR